jgi:hypothetical protein
MSLFPESMSGFKTYLDCKKKYEYAYVRGLKPKVSTTKVMDIGTLYHAALAGGYRNLKSKSSQNFYVSALHEIDLTVLNGYDYHGEVRKLAVEKEDVELVQDMLEYYVNHTYFNTIDKIIGVEVPIVLPIRGKREIRCTLDLISQEGGELVVTDHKSVGSVKESLEFLPLDIQSNFYEVAAWKHFGYPVEFVHAYQARKVPRELTRSGRKSMASQDPNDYIRRVRHKKSVRELQYVYDEICDLADEIEERVWYPREPQKGFMGCSGCAYKSICSAEQTGRTIPPSMIALEYDVVAQEASA